MINYDELAKDLATMKPRSRLYEMVKAEMVKRGRWKTKSKGGSFKRGYDPRRAPLQPPVTRQATPEEMKPAQRPILRRHSL